MSGAIPVCGIDPSGEFDPDRFTVCGAALPYERPVRSVGRGNEHSGRSACGTSSTGYRQSKRDPGNLAIYAGLGRRMGGR